MSQEYDLEAFCRRRVASLREIARECADLELKAKLLEMAVSWQNEADRIAAERDARTSRRA